MLTVMINRCPGVFNYSDEAMVEYHKIKPGVEEHQIERHDEVMLEIVQRLGEKAQGFGCKIVFKTINEVYRDHYEIDDHDGFESIRIEYDRYMLDRISKIMDNRDLTNDQKVHRTRALLSSVEFDRRCA